MNKKSLITMLVALCLVAAVGVGATLAYFTDTDAKTNTVTMGKVDIKLVESSDGTNGWEVGTPNDDTKGFDYTNLVPGEKISKEAKIVVAENSRNCYIRVKAEFTWNDKNADLPVVTLEDLAPDYNKPDAEPMWYYNSNDGFYYYKAICSAEDEIKFIDTLTVPTGWDNMMADKGFKVKLTAEAIQADMLDVSIVENNRVAGFITTWNLGDNQIQEYNAPVATADDNN